MKHVVFVLHINQSICLIQDYFNRVNHLLLRVLFQAKNRKVR